MMELNLPVKVETTKLQVLVVTAQNTVELTFERFLKWCESHGMGSYSFHGGEVLKGLMKVCVCVRVRVRLLLGSSQGLLQ